MPDYEFVCTKCRKKFSMMLSISDYEKQRKSLKCPKCGDRKVERRWSSVFAVTSKKS